MQPDIKVITFVQCTQLELYHLPDSFAEIQLDSRMETAVMNYCPVLFVQSQTDRQTDRQTDSKRCIRAHCA